MSAADIWDYVYYRQGKRMDMVTNKCIGGDLGQQGQQKWIECKAETAAAETWNGNKIDAKQHTWKFCKRVMTYIYCN